jgi:hypothetical protein
MLVAFPILALDEIGVELENPFSPNRLNHLPLDEICARLEQNLMFLQSHVNHTETPDGIDPSAQHPDLSGAGSRTHQLFGESPERGTDGT